MQSPSRKAGAARVFKSSPFKTPSRKGAFIDGLWHCNCSPRHPASHFQVKKESANKGRWFYTCPQSKEEERCGFFLWDDDAKSREKDAVLGNSRPALGMFTPAKSQQHGSPEKEAIETHNAMHNSFVPGLGTKAASEGDFGEWPLMSDDEVEVVQELERQASMGPPETPRKAVKVSTFSTPGSRTTRDEDAWPTPATNTRRDEDVFKTPATPRSRPEDLIKSARRGLPSPSSSPTPNRRLDFGAASSATGAVASADYDITAEVLELLSGQEIDEEMTAELRKLLNRYALKNSGIEKGRDVTRLALKAKDAKIEELQARITALETEREMDKVIIRHFKDDMSNSVSRRGRGRSRGS